MADAADGADAREDAARQTFTWLVSHALGGATHSISNALELLAMADGAETLTPRQRALVENASHATARLMQLSDDIQTLTHRAGASLQTRREPFPLTTLLREAVAQAQTPLAPTTPRAFQSHASPALALGDPTLARRALAALIENALRFSDRETTVVVEARKRHDRAIIRVQDAGVGIAPAEAQRIFEPLHVGARPLHQIGVGLGVGLGLSVARACAEAQGGRVWLEPPTAGGAAGAIFVLELPLAPAE